MSSWRKIPPTLWHLLLVTLLGLPLITPLLRWSVVPCTHDGHLHVHRVAAMRHGWENGLYFTRWLPDLALGYGYPFFIYREPTPLYAVLGPHLLGLPLPAASNLFYILTILACGWFTFLWAKDISGPRAAIVSAVAYMSAPYVLIDALVRGNAPESLALPLLPLLLWVGRRWMISGSLAAFLGAVFSLAFLSLSHNISTLIFTPIFFIYLLAIGRMNKTDWKVIGGRLLLLFGIGLGMTIFYSGGALLEMDQVTLSQSTTTRNNDFHFNFASWSEILTLPAPEDPNLLNPSLPIRLGWVPIVLGMVGFLSLFWKRGIGRRQRLHVIGMALAVIFFLFMALPISLPIWESVPLIDFVQFPWRFIGRAALPLAFLAGAPFASASLASRSEDNDEKRILPQLLLLAAVSLLMLETLPNLYPRYCPEKPFPSIVDVHDYEQATGLVGVDPEGSYFPRTVQKRPQNSPLLSDYQTGQVPQRFDNSVLPAGASADVQYSPLAAQIEIDTPIPFNARYLSFAFPGWRAQVDGREVAITPSDPQGLITFPVPAGRHVVEVRWQPTLLRTSLLMVSVLALIAAGAMVVLLRRKKKSQERNNQAEQETLIPEYLLLVVLSLLMLSFKSGVVDQGITPFNNGGAAAPEHPLVLQGDGLQFEGFSLPAENFISGQTFDIDLAWTTKERTSRSLQSNVWLAGRQGLLWSDKESQRPRLFEDAPPTWERAPGQWVWDSREVQILPGTPPGSYDLVLTLFDQETLAPLTFVGEDGAVIGPTAVIGQVNVLLPEQPAAVDPQYDLQESIPGSGLFLIGYNQDRESAAPGDPLLLTLFWRLENEVVDQPIALQLVDQQGRIVHNWQLPVSDSAETDPWDTKHILRRQLPLRLPATLESGTYQFRLQGSIPLSSITVDAPQRNFTAPQIELPIGENFAGSISLEGLNLLQQSPLAVELIWRAITELDQSYHVFIHLVDETGRIIAQSDGQPANWARPTSGWVPGEFIVDRHELPISQIEEWGRLRLRIGLYNPSTNERLTLSDGDYVEIPLPNER